MKTKPCPKCQSKMIISIKGWMCLRCFEVVGFKEGGETE